MTIKARLFSILNIGIEDVNETERITVATERGPHGYSHEMEVEYMLRYCNLLKETFDLNISYLENSNASKITAEIPIERRYLFGLLKEEKLGARRFEFR